MEIEKQYDRLLEQLREEVKELYWIYNFFFLVESVLVGHALNKLPVKNHMLFYAGFFLSSYWLWIFHKQRLWRKYWIDKIKKIEAQMSIPKPIRFFEQQINFFKSFKSLYSHGEIATALYFLPIAYMFF